MRTFMDDQNRHWDVVVGRESWGAFYAIFVPKEAGPELRQTALNAGSAEGAERELEALDRQGLQELFAHSSIKRMDLP